MREIKITNSILRDILRCSLRENSIEEFLIYSLSLIFTEANFQSLFYAEIYLIEWESRRHTLVASQGVAPHAHQTREIKVFGNPSGDRKSPDVKSLPEYAGDHIDKIHFERESAASRYDVPILDGENNVLGALHLYLDDTHVPNEVETDFLQAASDVMASVFKRKNIETQLMSASKRAVAAELELNTQKSALDEHAIVVLSDLSGNFIYANEKFCQISGYRYEELIGANHRLVSSGYHPKSFFAEMFDCLEKGQIWRGEIKNKSKDGSDFWLYTTIVPMRNSEGSIYQYIAIRTDITKLKKNEEIINYNIGILETTFNNFPGGVSYVDRGLVLRLANPAFYKLLNLPREKFPPGTAYEEIIRHFAARGEYGEGDVEELVRVRLGLVRKFAKHAFKRSGPDGMKLDIKGSPIPQGGFITTYMDITESENMMAALEEKTAQAVSAAEELRRTRDIQEQTHQHLLSSVNSMRNGFAIWGADDRLLLANDAFLNLHGPVREIIKEGLEHREFVSAGLEHGLWDTGDLDKSEWLEQRRSDRRNVNGTDSEIRFADGRLVVLSNQVLENNDIISTIIDITAQRKREADLQDAKLQLEKIAYFDELTGLANRAGCQKDLVEKFTGDTPVRHLAVIQIDIDNFKRVNDTLGHAAGDFLLRTLSKRLSLFADDYSGMSPYRWGGDEFICLLERDDKTDLEAVCRELTEVFAIPTEIENTTIRSTVSLGIARYPEDARDVDALVVFADLALYKTKELGRDGFQFFTSEMKDMIDAEMKVEHDLRIAIDEGQLELYFQPQIDITNGAITGLEGLLRWNHPERGVISPGEFMSVVESAGLAPAVGRKVFDDAMAAIRIWSGDGLEFGRVAVNLSPRHLKKISILDDFFGCVEKHRIEPRFLAVEILESYLLDEPDSDISDILNQFRARDVRVELDDFGTGYASLSHLSTLPINGLKIDQSFVAGVGDDHRQQGIISSLVSLAKLMKLGVVCEGVETWNQFEALSRIGKCSVQGYLFAQPMCFADATDWITTEKNLAIFNARQTGTNDEFLKTAAAAAGITN